MADAKQGLVAIPNADVIGYSRLMLADQEATLEAVRCCGSEIDRLAKQRGQQVVDGPGDAILAECLGAVEAAEDFVLPALNGIFLIVAVPEAAG